MTAAKRLAVALVEAAEAGASVSPHTLALARRLASKKATPAQKITRGLRQAVRAEKSRRRSELRAQAMERDKARCVICGMNHIEMHMHHLRGHAHEGLSDVAILCPTHHFCAHAADVHTLRALAAWATERGYREAAMALSRRIAKVEEARRE